MNWTTVFMGPVAQAELLRCELEAMGIPVFIPDENIRTIDPIAVGGLLVFDRAVQVPPSAVERARAVVEGLDGVRQPTEAETELPADDFESESTPAPDRAQARAEAGARSRRILWGTLFALVGWVVPWQLGAIGAIPSLLLALTVLAQARGYIAAVTIPEARPNLHGLTLVAIGISGLCAVVTIAALPNLLS